MEASRTVGTLKVQKSGEGSPMLLLHGFGAGNFTWREWVPELERRFTVFQVELKGFGEAPKPRDGRYSPEDQATAVLDLIQHLELRDITIVGHSLGGGIALMVAVRLLGEPGRLRQLVLIAPAAYRQPLPSFIALARLPGASFFLWLLPSRWSVLRVLKEVFFDHGKITKEIVEAYARPLRSRGGAYGVVRSARQIIPPDLESWTARYPEISSPTLLLWGEEDRVVPPWIGERLLGELPQSRMVTLPGCGHDPPEECPQDSLGVVLEFLDER